MAPFIMIEKRPKVRSVIGSVSNIRTGLMKVFTMESTRETRIAVINPSIRTLGSKYAVIATAKALMRTLTRNFMPPY